MFALMNLIRPCEGGDSGDFFGAINFKTESLAGVFGYMNLIDFVKVVRVVMVWYKTYVSSKVT